MRTGIVVMILVTLALVAARKGGGLSRGANIGGRQPSAADPFVRLRRFSVSGGTIDSTHPPLEGTIRTRVSEPFVRPGEAAKPETELIEVVLTSPTDDVHYAIVSGRQVQVGSELRADDIVLGGRHVLPRHVIIDTRTVGRPVLSTTALPSKTQLNNEPLGTAEAVRLYDGDVLVLGESVLNIAVPLCAVHVGGAAAPRGRPLRTLPDIGTVRYTVGRTPDGAPVDWRLGPSNRHLLVVGASGTGKTALLRRLATATPARSGLLVDDADGDLVGANITGHHVDPLAGLRPTLDGAVFTAEQAWAWERAVEVEADKPEPSLGGLAAALGPEACEALLKATAVRPRPIRRDAARHGLVSLPASALLTCLLDHLSGWPASPTALRGLVLVDDAEFGRPSSALSLLWRCGPTRGVYLVVAAQHPVDIPDWLVVGGTVVVFRLPAAAAAAMSLRLGQRESTSRSIRELPPGHALVTQPGGHPLMVATSTATAPVSR